MSCDPGVSLDRFGPSANFKTLRLRADLLRRIRAFFDDRHFVEVETPVISVETIAEAHIDPMALAFGPVLPAPTTPTTWLQASPEAHMKRLLAAGAPSIYQITRSFRAEERGAIHNPEFTIVEWYGVDDDVAAGIDLLDRLCQKILDTRPATRTSYRDTFVRHTGIDPHTATDRELAEAASEVSSSNDSAIEQNGPAWTRDDCLNLLLAERIEPHLGVDAPEVIFDYPASQAALARIRHETGKPAIAERFELYWRGTELANGYHELTDATEFRSRLAVANAQRRDAGKTVSPEPAWLLAAMDAGLPPCSGVALGFDRLVMLATGAKTIDEVMAFPSDRA